MNLKSIALVVLGFNLVGSMSMAASPMDKYLRKLAILDTNDGRTIETYEDVFINLDPFQKRNKEYPIININEIPEGYVSEKTAKKFFKKFSSHAVVTDERISFRNFMNEHFSIDGITDFPNNYFANKPGSHTLYLRMDDNYKYVQNFKKFSPDAISCRSDRSLCDESCEYTHKYKNKIYSEFRNKLISKSKLEDADEIYNKKNYIKLSLKKRTPVAITFDGKIAEEKNDFPVLGGDISYDACTSGDWYLTPEGILIGEENPPIYHAKFSFGRFGECPENDEDWKNAENWTNLENIVEINYGNFDEKIVGIPYFRDVVRFRPFDGFIRYSIFAKEGDVDGKSPVNPSVIVQENRPDIGYGYLTAGDLGNTPETAKDWPLKKNLGEISGKGFQDGLIRVYDNDKPNIIIRITNVETDEQMFFPPCLASSACELTISKTYKSVCGPNKNNKDDYDYFVQNLGPDYNYDVLSKVPAFTPYYTIYSIDDQNIKTATEKSYIDRLLLNKDVKFINENVRVEDYFASDKDEKGQPTFKIFKKGSFGKRRGTCSNMVALFENKGSFRFKTGVEYKLDVWTDDNVKWTNIEYEEGFDGGPEMHYEKVRNTGIIPHSGTTFKSSDSANYGDLSVQLMIGKPKLLDKAKVFDTGIKKGIIKLNIPNESENLNEEQNINISKHINGDIYFTLKDPTPPEYNLKTVEELEKKGFPSITVVAEDFAGLKRTLRLFFRVNDRNLDVKVLENNIK
jgi:hypothetical protein